MVNPYDYKSLALRIPLKIVSLQPILQAMVQLSGVLITYNEEKHIEEVITNISFVDEIIVVDSFSTDKTLEKLKKFPQVKVIQHKFKNFPDQRNFAIEQATGEWILFIDADERIPKKLKKEILNTLKKPLANAYSFKRRFVIDETIIKFSGYQTDKIHRLFKKGKAFYDPKRLVHEILKVEGKTVVLKNYLLHYSFDSYKSYKEKNEFYARLKAEELFMKNKTPTLFDHYIKPLYKFVYNYIFRLGILDGKAGFNICYLHAHGASYRYQHLEKLIYSSKT